MKWCNITWYNITWQYNIWNNNINISNLWWKRAVLCDVRTDMLHCSKRLAVRFCSQTCLIPRTVYSTNTQCWTRRVTWPDIPVYGRYRHGSHPYVLRTKWTTLYSVDTQHRFIFIAPYTFATCFGPLSGHHQACQYKHHLEEVTVKQNVRIHLFTVAVLFKY
jgi:hypothetical protein